MSAEGSPSEARSRLDALPGLTWSHWTAADLPDISAMLTAVEAADQPSERHSLAELEEDFGSQIHLMARDCLLARDEAGEVVAIARAVCTDSDVEVRRALLAGAVRPDRRGSGIGREVMAWQLAHAYAWYRTNRRPDHGPLRLSVFADCEAMAEQRLAERFGLRRVRFFAELTRSLDQDFAPDAEVPGIEVRPWSAATPEQTLAVRNAAFRDHWGSVERPLAGWLEQLRSSSFRPGWSFVAVDTSTDTGTEQDPGGGEVVAFVMSTAYEQDWEPRGYRSGYIDLLATLREHRGRGIATALIGRAVRAFRDDGMDAAEIGVDSQNRTGALGLYTGLGFAQTSGTVQLMREEATP